jgi:hypothetical protein
MARGLHQGAAMTEATKQLNDHFATLESLLADLKAKIEASHSPPSLVTKPSLPTPDERVARARKMLSRSGSITASEVQLELGVSHSTAMRTMQAIARSRDGIIVLEPTGPTFRARLWHSDRVILDHQPAE